jgi:hypothetical protein
MLLFEVQNLIPNFRHDAFKNDFYIYPAHFIVKNDGRMNAIRRIVGAPILIFHSKEVWEFVF